MTKKRLGSLMGLLAFNLLSTQADAYNYRRHIPEEFQHFVPDDDSNDFPDSASDHSDAMEKYGPTHYSKRTFSTLTVYGPTELHHVTIKGALNVHGPLEAHHTTIQHLEVMGPVDCAHTIIEGESILFGPLDAKHSKFKGALRIATNVLTLKDSEVASLTLIPSNSNHKRIQRVHLHHGTVIQGDIVFEEDDGLVILHKGAKILGKVIGGVIKHHD